MKNWIEIGVTEVGISGGEPFLFPDKVIELVKGLKSLKVKTVRPFSNGFWGANRNQAIEILTALKKAGFGSDAGDRLKISVGEFHQSQVSIEAVMDLCQYHWEIIGTRCELDVEQVFHKNMIKQIIAIAKRRHIHDKIEWRLREKFSNSGRAKNWFKDIKGPTIGLEKLKCPVKSRGALYPEGDWVYCTGTTYPKKFLAQGTITQNSPFTLLAKAQFDPRIPYLQFGTFSDYSPQSDLRIPEQATACSICPKIFGGRVNA